MLASRGAQLLLLTFAVIAGSYARTALSPLQETMRSALALTDHQIALLQGPALALSLVLAAIPLGIAIDRYARQRLLLVFVVLSAVGSVLTAEAHGFAMLFMARVVIGLSANATSLAAWSIVADLYARSERGRAGTALVIGQAGGMALAFWAGGELITMFGPAGEGWRSALRLMTVVVALVVFSTLLIREPPRQELATQDRSMRGMIRELWRFRDVVAPLVSAMVLVEIAFQAAWVWAAPTLSRSFALSPQRIGAVMGAALLFSGIVGPLAGGALADFCQRTRGPRRSMLLMCLLTLVSSAAALFGVMPDVTSASVLLIAFMTIACAVFVMTSAVIVVIVPNELRGVCLAFSAGANALFGVGLAPVMVSALSGALGEPSGMGKALAIVSVVACVLGAAVFLIGARVVSVERAA